MRLNAYVSLRGAGVQLVPYRRLHVPKYHDWMKSQELQLLTASEPLTLEEEYQMQDSWLLDEDKCTFIILEKAIYEQKNDEVESMIGDTNVFLKRLNGEIVGEIEIMIAEKEARERKLGWESAVLMLLYGITYINLLHFEAKISNINSASIRMFEKLGFKEVSRSDVFKEITLDKVVDDEWVRWLSQQCKLEVLPHEQPL